MERYWLGVADLYAKIRATQRENIIKTGELIANAVENGHKIWFSGICHGVEGDVLGRGGGPIFYRTYEADKVQPGDVLFVSSVSGRTKSVNDLTYDSVSSGVNVIVFTSMEYAAAVDAVHESGKKLYEMATIAIDNCAPAAEAMLDVEGIEAKFAAASGIASDYILWSITCIAVEKMLTDGYTPGIYKSAKFPGGNDYNKTVIEPHYEKYGW